MTAIMRPAPAPEPLPAEAFDAHTHLDMLGDPVADVLAQAVRAGITRVVTVGCDLPSSRWAASCAAEHDGVYAAVAIHPNETAFAVSRPAPATGRSARQAVPAGLPRPAELPSAGLPSAGLPSAGLTGAVSGSGAAGSAALVRSAGGVPGSALAADRDAVLAEIAELAGLPQVRAVGETGLDYYRDSSPPTVQREWFRAHIEIAKRSRKALMIHDRDAHSDVLAILEQEGPPEHVIFHCFSGDAAMARRCAGAGYVLSFAGTVTFAGAAELRAAAAATPADQILVETDAPYLTPVPNRGKANAPAQAAHTLRAIADVKKLDVAELCRIVTATGERVFGGWRT